MLGTAFQDPNVMANTIYIVGINLVNDRNPVEGIAYKLDDAGVAILIPFQAITGPMFSE
jgi:methyl-galactoside transport system substrate-binding protein